MNYVGSAHDQVMFSNTEKDMQRIMNGLRFNRKINVKKTKMMRLSRLDDGRIDIYVSVKKRGIGRTDKILRTFDL